MSVKKNLMFLCTGNSCRSQMAEGFARKLWGSEFEVYSAGTKKHGMNERAIQVMKEVGVDLSNHFSKTVDDLPNVNFDYIVTVCDAAKESCPYFSGGKVIHIGFQDPPALAKSMTDEDEILAVYRRVRDEIDLAIRNLKDYLQ